MSFFIRKRGERITTAINKKPKPSNTEMKNRPNLKKFEFQRGRGMKRSQGSRGGRIGTNQGFSKKPKFDPNEEIESSTDDEEYNEGITDKPGQIEQEKDDEIQETAQEKKIRLAKLYLEEIEKEEQEREENEEVDVDLLVAKRLREDILESEGRLRREISDSISFDPNMIFSLTSSKHLKKSVTCLCISHDDKWIFSGCKDGHLFKWSMNDKKKVLMVKRKETLSKRKQKKGFTMEGNVGNPNSCHSSAITSIAISSDGKYLATGDLNKQVVIWHPDTLARIHIFTGHRGPVRSLVFRHKTHTLYSSSDDRSIRIWSLDEMGYVETLFGHQDTVTSVDALSRERAISSGGRDSSIRVWKIVEESQLVYNAHPNGSVDIVKLINEENFLSGGDDGLLCTWNVNRKKPLVVLPKSHGVEKSFDGLYEFPRWISSLATWTNTDLVASGSNDGFLRLWKCGDRFKTLTPVLKIPCVGWINSIQFSHGAEINSKFLAVGIGKEHKSGRWSGSLSGVKNSIIIIPLIPKGKPIEESDSSESSPNYSPSSNGLQSSQICTDANESNSNVDITAS